MNRKQRREEKRAEREKFGQTFNMYIKTTTMGLLLLKVQTTDVNKAIKITHKKMESENLEYIEISNYYHDEFRGQIAKEIQL